MAKIIEPAIGSVWEHEGGQRFQVIASISASVGQAEEHQLQALATGRRHWVTNQGLLQRKYTWIADPADEDEEGGEDARGI
jgi:hypothetical protein